jgi:ParB family chromosome partitioning protein
VETVAIDSIKVVSKYLRTDTNVEKLKKSIQTIGLINPVVVNEKYELIAGGRRYSALKELGYKEIPVSIVNQTQLQQELISIDENLVRKDLTRVEVEECLARGKEIYERLFPNATKTEDDIDTEIKSDMPDEERSFIDITAEKTGLSKRTIKSAIDRDEKSSPKVKQLRSAGELNATQANELIKLTPEEQEQVADLVVSKSAKEVKKLVNSIKETKDVASSIEEVINAPSFPKEYQSLQTLSKRFNKLTAKILLEEMNCEHEDMRDLLSSLSALRHNIDQLMMLNTLTEKSSNKPDEKYFSEENLELTPQYQVNSSKEINARTL